MYLNPYAIISSQFHASVSNKGFYRLSFSPRLHYKKAGELVRVINTVQTSQRYAFPDGAPPARYTPSFVHASDTMASIG